MAAFGPPQWLAVIYLGLFGSALTFYLWAFALSRTTPTRVAISVTVNPITAALVGAVILTTSMPGLDTSERQSDVERASLAESQRRPTLLMAPPPGPLRGLDLYSPHNLRRITLNLRRMRAIFSA